MESQNSANCDQIATVDRQEIVFSSRIQSWVNSHVDSNLQYSNLATALEVADKRELEAGKVSQSQPCDGH